MSDLVHGHIQVCNLLPRGWPSRVSKVSVAPLGQIVRAAVVKPCFNGSKEMTGKPIFACSLRGADARELVKLLVCQFGDEVGFWP